MKRTARQIEGAMEHASMDNWIILQRRMSWRWIGKLFRSTDGRWSRAILDWSPICDGTRYGAHAQKHQGGQRKKYMDKIFTFFADTPDWMEKALDENYWKKKEDEYAQYNK